jgi:hypothetical protein
VTRVVDRIERGCWRQGSEHGIAPLREGFRRWVDARDVVDRPSTGRYAAPTATIRFTLH